MSASVDPGERVTCLVRARLAIALAYAWKLQGEAIVAERLLLAARTFIRAAQDARREAA